MPKQVGGNPPVYPPELKSRNITGKVKVRLTIYKDGSVKGAKVLSTDNSVNKDEDPDLYDKANKLRIAEELSERMDWPLHIIEETRDDPKLEQPGAFLDALYESMNSGYSTLAQ